jgi:hypothetical protein
MVDGFVLRVFPVTKSRYLSAEMASFGQYQSAIIAIFALRRPFPQYVLLDLSCTGLWQLLDNLNFPRNHEFADTAVVLGPIDKIFAFQLRARLNGDESFGPLSPLFVFDCNYTGLEHVRMRDQH